MGGRTYGSEFTGRLSVQITGGLINGRGRLNDTLRYIYIYIYIYILYIL